MTAKARNHDAALACALMERVSAGMPRLGEWKATLHIDELAVEVQIRVRPRSDPAEAQKHIDAAIAMMEAWEHWPSCRHWKTKRGIYGSSSCNKGVAAVLVCRAAFKFKPDEPDLNYRFYCRQHAELGVTDKNVVGMFDLPKYRLDRARKIVAKREQAIWDARDNEERWARVVALVIYSLCGIAPPRHIDVDEARRAARR